MLYKLFPFIFLLAVSHLSPTLSLAEIRLPKIFSDHMVLQREEEIRFWGWAQPREEVFLEFEEEIYASRSNREGYWELSLPPQKAGGPHTLIFFSSNQRIILKDVLFGEVWLCSGQSNMEYSLAMLDKQAAMEAADKPKIRLFNVGKRLAFTPEQDLKKGRWKICSPGDVKDFSAVAYFFGKELQDSLEVPIGLIDASWGGTVLETWLSPEAASTVSYYREALNSLSKGKPKKVGRRITRMYKRLMKSMGKADAAGLIDDRALWAAPDYDDKKWGEMQLPGIWENQGLAELNGVVWFRKEVKLSSEEVGQEALLSLGKIDDSDMVWVNGVFVGGMEDGYKKERQYLLSDSLLKEGRNLIAVRVHDMGGKGGLGGPDSALFLKSTKGKKSLTGSWKYRISGREFSLVMPGSHPNDQPTLLFNGMIHPFKGFPMQGVIWYQGESNAWRGEEYRDLFKLLINDWRQQWKLDFSFYFVQLANWNDPRDQPHQDSWAELREAQAMALSLPKTGMAVSIDIGEADDIHPQNKEEVGRRLALHALAKDYGRALAFSGPIYEEMSILGDSIRLKFQHTQGGLKAGIQGQDKELMGFKIAGKDGRFYPAQASIRKGEVWVHSLAVRNPIAVRYAWTNNPTSANLYNDASLPAAPFRTDNWPLRSKGKTQGYIPLRK